MCLETAEIGVTKSSEQSTSEHDIILSSEYTLHVQCGEISSAGGQPIESDTKKISRETIFKRPKKEIVESELINKFYFMNVCNIGYTL